MACSGIHRSGDFTRMHGGGTNFSRRLRGPAGGFLHGLIIGVRAAFKCFGGLFGSGPFGHDDGREPAAYLLYFAKQIFAFRGLSNYPCTPTWFPCAGFSGGYFHPTDSHVESNGFAASPQTVGPPFYRLLSPSLSLLMSDPSHGPTSTNRQDAEHGSSLQTSSRQRSSYRETTPEDGIARAA